MQKVWEMRGHQIQERLELAETQEELKYCVMILKYYKQLSDCIRVEKLTTKLYIKYLEFLTALKL
jgi:hypothetical protein